MGFSAGIVRHPQSGQPVMGAAVFNAGDDESYLNEGDIAVRSFSHNMENPYGIPGSQGPAINIARAAEAIRGEEVAPITTIDRRIDPQYGVHARQEQIPGRPFEPGHVTLNNRFDPPGTPSHLDWGTSADDAPYGDPHSATTEINKDGLNYGPAPQRIPHVWNSGLNAAAGLDQYSFQQQNYRLFLRHIYPSRVAPQPTRGIRSVSGVHGSESFATSSRVRIPAIFVPSAVG